MSQSKDQKGGVPPLLLGIAGILTPLIALLLGNDIDLVVKAFAIPVALIGMVSLLAIALILDHNENMEKQKQAIQFATIEKEIKIAQINAEIQKAGPEMAAMGGMLGNILLGVFQDPEAMKNIKAFQETKKNNSKLLQKKEE